MNVPTKFGYKLKSEHAVWRCYLCFCCAKLSFPSIHMFPYQMTLTVKCNILVRRKKVATVIPDVYLSLGTRRGLNLMYIESQKSRLVIYQAVPVLQVIMCKDALIL